MSSIQKRKGNATELRLDYEDISSGQLVIVIQGLPTGLGDTLTHPAHALRAMPGTAPNGIARQAASSSPLLEETDAIHDETAWAPVLGASLVLAAWKGQEARTKELIAVATENAVAEHEPRATALAEYANAVLCNGLGHYGEGLEAAKCACEHEDLCAYPRALLELVEAAARSGADEIAEDALDRLDAWACADGSAWALGIRARSTALLREGHEAETLFLEGIELLSRSGSTAHLARAQLLYGEWLRRENRRVDARVQLRAAHTAFSRISAEGFAERALRELLATGETARKRTDDARAFLTPQEAQIARLAQDGLSNPEIGAMLFISPRTVQYHLRKVFQKLGITSRRQLGRIPPERLDIAA